MRNSTDDPDESPDGEGVPAPVREEVERLTRLARTASDDGERAAYRDRRERLLAEHGFTARVREEGDAVLVLYPEEWREDGVVRTDRIEDTSRAIEIPLEGSGDPDDWETVEAHNRDLASAVREAHGDVHGDNADALADYVGNHYAKRIESLSGAELTEFRTDYFVRNAWPSEEQRAVIDESIELVYEIAGEPVPEYRFQ